MLGLKSTLQWSCASQAGVGFQVSGVRGGVQMSEDGSLTELAECTETDVHHPLTLFARGAESRCFYEFR